MLWSSGSVSPCAYLKESLLKFRDFKMREIRNPPHFLEILTKNRRACNRLRSVQRLALYPRRCWKKPRPRSEF